MNLPKIDPITWMETEKMINEEVKVNKPQTVPLPPPQPTKRVVQPYVEVFKNERIEHSKKELPQS